MALLKNLVSSLLWHGSVETTEPKAKEAKSLAEKMITLGKTKDLHSRRQARKFINDESLVRKLFEHIAPQYADRPGGYARIIKLGVRRGDAALLVRLELVDFQQPE